MAKNRKIAGPEKYILRDVREVTAVEQYWRAAGRPTLRKPPKNYKYIDELAHLQFELIKLQEWVRLQGLKVAVIFEGRDAAGKGGEQERRFQERIRNPIKRWKLSPMDVESRKRWVEYSKAKDVMFAHTDRKKTPWYVVNADDKKRARLNCIRHLLNQIPFQDMRPVEIEIPPRQRDTGYKRPRKSSQRFVAQVY